MTSAVVKGRTVNLLGRPHIDGQDGGYRIRSRKSWALLAYLLLSDRPPTRRHLAGLLFDEADDPLGALRWSLAELRRSLAGDATIDGDPVVLRLDPDLVVDVDVIASGTWTDAVGLTALGSELLEGFILRGAGVFESWLLAEQRRVAAASAEILRKAALSCMSRGAYQQAIGYAVRLVAMTPLDETCHTLLIQLYRRAGDDMAARRQLATCRRMLAAELGIVPGDAMHAALRESLPAAAADRSPTRHRHSYATDLTRARGDRPQQPDPPGRRASRLARMR